MKQLSSLLSASCNCDSEPELRTKSTQQCLKVDWWKRSVFFFKSLSAKKLWLKIQKTLCDVPDHFWLTGSTEVSYHRFLTDSEQRFFLPHSSFRFLFKSLHVDVIVCIFFCADGWMSLPQGVPLCPPGLEYLTSIDQLLVHQKWEVLEGTHTILLPCLIIYLYSVDIIYCLSIY